MEPFASFDYAVNFEQSLSETKGGILNMEEKRRNELKVKLDEEISSEVGLKGYYRD